MKFEESKHPRDDAGKFSTGSNHIVKNIDTSDVKYQDNDDSFVVFSGVNKDFGGKILNNYDSPFHGLFATNDLGAAKSHGDGSLSAFRIKNSDALAQRDLKQLDDSDIEAAIIKSLPIEIEPGSDEYYDIYDAVVDENEPSDEFNSLFQDYKSEFDLSGAWFAQRLRSEMAENLGYKAISTTDEHGMSWMLVPGVTAIDYSELAKDRTIDIDGRLRVERSNITKAMVCPYLGREIPVDGLIPDKIYHLLRDPIELEKAAESFRNVQLLIEHTPVSADDPQKDVIVGSLGSNVTWEPPYLVADLIVWDADAIAGIESKEQTELSCGYRYRADMTPGVYENVPYDGVMRDIIGNHVALVDVGRAGHDVIVGDKAMKFKLTPKALMLIGALNASVRPKLAADAKLQLKPILHDVTDLATVKKKLVATIKPLLAADAKLSLDELIDELIEDSDDDPVEMVEDEDDEWEDDPEKPGEKRKKAPALDMDEVEEKVKQAEDRAAKRITDLFEAREIVAPLVGKVALDSAEAVYKYALDHAKVKTDGVHPSAYRPMVEMLLANKDQKPAPIAQDANLIAETSKRFGLERFR